jgi:hypothetical protein
LIHGFSGRKEAVLARDVDGIGHGARRQVSGKNLAMYGFY